MHMLLVLMVLIFINTTAPQKFMTNAINTCLRTVNVCLPRFSHSFYFVPTFLDVQDVYYVCVQLRALIPPLCIDTLG